MNICPGLSLDVLILYDEQKKKKKNKARNRLRFV